MPKHQTLGARVLTTVEQERTFPRSILDTKASYGVLGELVRLIEPHTEADSAAILIQFLVAFGNVIGRKAHFRVEADKHYLNLFATIVGQSAKGRKGTSWGYIRNIFDSLEKDWLENNVTNGLSSGEGLIKALSARKKQSDEDTDEQYDQEPDKRLLTQEGEFASVLQVLKREGNTLSAFLRNLWDTGSVSLLTRNDPLKVSNAHVSIIGHITKDELLKLLTNNEAGNGFANRFLWVYVQRSKRLPEGGNIQEADFYHIEKRIKRAIEFGKQTELIKRDEDARVLWFDAYEELSAEHVGMLGSVTARAEPQTMRLACLYALLDCSPVVRRVHLEAALALWNYCFDSAAYIFGNSTGDSVTEKILQGLNEAGEDGLTTTQISGLFDRNLPSPRVRSTLEKLESDGFVKSEKKSGKGRPAEIWRIVESHKINEENELNEEKPVRFEPKEEPHHSPFSQPEYSYDPFENDDEEGEDEDESDDDFYRRAEEEGEY